MKKLSKLTRRSLLPLVALGSSILLVLVAGQAFALPAMTSTLSVSTVTSGNKVDLTTQIPGVSDVGSATQEIIQTIDSSKVRLTSASDVIAPEGWTVTYSTDGTNFSATPSSWAAVVKVKATGSVNSGGLTGDGKQLYQTNASAPGSTATPNGVSRSGGDGWDVEFDSRGYIYNWYHHGALTSGLDCRDRFTGALCAGSWPMPLASSGFYSPFQSTLFFDEVNKHIWLPAADRSTGTGFLCIDVTNVAAPALCGGSKATAWTMLNARASAQETGIEQIIASQGKIYSWDILSGKILCYDYLANNGLGAACSNMPAITVTAGSANSLNSNPQNSMTYFREAFGNLYGELNLSVTCFNATTMEKCTGWSSYSQTLTSGSGHAMYLQPNAAGAIVGVCTATNAKCFAADGTTFSTTSVVQNALNNGSMGRWNGSMLTVGSRFLFNNIWDKPSYLFCYDYATSAACSGWGASSFNGVTGVGQISGSRVYTMDVDPLSSDCIWTNSDNGSPMIGQVTISTGTSGCSIKLATSTFKQKDISPRLTCDANTGLGYNRFTLSGLTKGTDYTSASLTIFKANGDVLVSGGNNWSDVAFNSENYVDLTSIVPSELGQNAVFKVNYVGKSSTNAATGTLLKKSSSAQLCLSLTANLICPSTLLIGTPTDSIFTFSATGATINASNVRTDYSITSDSLNISAPLASQCGFVLNAVTMRGKGDSNFTNFTVPVQGAVATLTNTSGVVLTDAFGSPITATSDANGEMSFGAVKAGSYKVAFNDFPLVNGFGAGDVSAAYVSPWGYVGGQVLRTNQNPEGNFTTIQTPVLTPTFTGVAGTPVTVKASYIMRGVAVNDTASTSAGVAVTKDVLANDSASTTASINTSTLKICAINTTSGCALTTLTVTGQGTYTVTSGKIVFTPLSTFGGTSTITYGITDTYSGAQPLNATLVTTVVRAPIATADTLSGNTLAPITVDVTANDSPDPSTSLNVSSVKLCAVGTTTGCNLTSVLITGKGTYSVDNTGVVTFSPISGVLGAIDSVTYSVTDLLGATSTSTVTATVTQTPPTITTGAFSTATINAAGSYTQTVTAGSGTIPVSGAWKVLTGALPTGMTLNTATGAITGTPTVAGTYAFTVQVTDSNSKIGTKAETILVAAPPVITTTPTTQKLYTSVVSSIASTVTAGTGSIPATGAWSATGLPAGISINADTGEFTGTPTTNGTFTVVSRVTDSNGLSATKTITMTVVTPPTITTTQPFAALLRGSAITAIAQTYTAGSASIPGTGAWSISSGALPTGLVINANTGAITGTPTVGGSFSFTVKLVDAGSEFSTKVESLVVAAAPTITTATSSQKLYTGSVVSIVSSATVGTAAIPATGAWSATGLPAGITINADTGEFTGTPTTAGTYSVVEKVIDANGLFATKTITITVVTPPTITTSQPFVALARGVVMASIPQTYTAGSATIAASGAWTISSGALPTGLVLNANTGAITGTPTVVGSYTFTVKLTDTGAEFSTKIEALLVANAPTVTTTPLTRKIYTTEETSIPSTVTLGSVALPSDAWTATGLPAGLAIDPATGTISGTPTTPGTYTVVERATDINGLSDTETITIKVVARPSITTPLPLVALVQGSAITAINQTKTAGSAAIAVSAAWSISSGSLPAGLTFNTATGAITGTPTNNGTFTYTVKLTDVDGEYATQTQTLIVAAPPTITTAPTSYKVYTSEQASILSTATQGTAGFSPTNSWSATGLPAGLAIDPATGTISGIPTATGTFTTIERVTDLNGLTDTKSLTIKVVAKPSITTALPFATLVQGASITTIDQTKQAGSALIPTTGAWTISSGALPTGLSLNANTGAITGTPSIVGTYNFTLKLTDADGEFTTKQETLVIAAPPTITTSTAVVKIYTGELGSIPSSATPGSAAIATTGAWSATGLPAGLSIDADTGEITGTPTLVGTYSVLERVTDLNGFTDTETVTIKVVTKPVITTALPFTTLVTGVVATPISQTKAAGTAAIPLSGAWSISSGSLPNGMTINPDTGVISGTPTQAGSFSFTVKLTDTDGEIATKLESIQVIAPPVITTSPTSYKLYVSEVASITSTVARGTGDILSSGAWTATGLPSGLSIDPTNGTISGTPSVTGTFTVTEKVTDVNSLFDSKVLAIKVVRKPSITTSLPLPALVKDVLATAINQSKTAGSAAIPVTAAWSISDGSLPAGLTLNPDTGAITGTPSVAGVFSFTVKIVDADGEIGTKVESITVNTPPVVTTTPLTIKLYKGEAASLPSSATAGTGNIPSTGAWTATGLPSGLSINPNTGEISGTPTANGSFTAIEKVTDVNSLFDTETIAIKVVTRPQITTTLPLQALGKGSLSAPIAQTKTAGSALIGTTGAWSITAGSLPTGLVLNVDTGEITGTPTVAGVFEFTLKLVDVDGEFTTKVETLTVNAPPTITTTELTKTVNANVLSTIANTLTQGTGAIPIFTGWSATGLPAGMNINGTNGEISGTPTIVGTYPVTVTVTDVNGLSDTEVITITVVDGPVITTSPTGYKFGVNNDLNFMADDFFAGQFPISKSRIIINTANIGSFPIKTTGGWSASGLPEGLVINPDNGKISGTATTVGEYPVVVTVTDTAGNSGSKVLNISIVEGPKNTTQRVWNIELDIKKGIGMTPVNIAQTYTLGSAELSNGRPVPFLIQGAKPSPLSTVSIVDGSITILPYLFQTPGSEKYGAYTFKTLIVDKNGAYDLATFTINLIKPGSNITTLPLPVGITDGMQMTNSSYPLAGTSSKKLPVSYESATPKVCTVDTATKTLKMVNEGTCTFSATSGTGALISTASQSFKITKLPQTASIVTPGTTVPGGTIIAPMPTDDPDGFQLYAALTSGLAPVYESLDPNVCSIDDTGLVTWDADLTSVPRVESDFSCRIRVSNPGDTTYSAAAPQIITLVATHVEPPAPEGGITKEPAQTAALPASGGTTPMKGANSFKVVVDKTKKTVTVFPQSKGRWIGPIYADIKITYTPKGSTVEETQICARNYFGIGVVNPKTKIMLTPALGGDMTLVPELAKNAKDVAALIKTYQAMQGKYAVTKKVKGKKVVLPGYLDYKYFTGQATCVLNAKAYAAWKSGVQIKALATVTRDRRWPTSYTRYKSFDWKHKVNNGTIYPTVVDWIITVG